MKGVVALIEMFEDGDRRNKSLVQIGSSSTGPLVYQGLVEVWDAVERRAGIRASRFYIGLSPSRDGKSPGLAPIMHLELISEIVDDLSEQSRAQFDIFCETFPQSQKRMNRLSVRIPNAIRQSLINLRRKFGFRISDDLLLGVRGWWRPWVWGPKHLHSDFRKKYFSRPYR